ncbi:hypothetical protein KYY02_18790 [Streptomyces pimonensis]|uniref:Uncharacterized protein n=1 Tax=Streptomyces pimonensis TaxID=2860288 RepID=A0ABV4J164_9ACTN
MTTGSSSAGSTRRSAPVPSRCRITRRVYLRVDAAEGHVCDDARAGVRTALDPLFPAAVGAGPPCRTGNP